jgi:hypothetical protein
VLNFKRYKLIPHAIEIGGAYWTKKRIVKFHIICFLSHNEKRLINDHRDSKREIRGTSSKVIKSKTKYTKVEPKFSIRYLFEKPFSSK